MDDAELLKKAQAVLKQNDRKKWTVPAGNLYPHQWLWDSCFIAIGLRHLDIERAQTEIKSLFRGQWSNGMIPNIIFSGGAEHRSHREMWRSYVSPYSPQNIATSGITQPPLLAEAIVQIGRKLKMPERRSWYKEVFSELLHYHEWLYAERDPHGEGLIVLLHPYESGMDNSPAWISELRKHNMPWWISLIERLHLDGIVNLVRRDTRHVPPGQRMSNIEAMGYWAAIHRLRRKAYNSEALLSRSLFAVEDLGFNCIFIRANEHLRAIAKDIGYQLPDTLLQRMRKTEETLEQLWDEPSGQYYSRSFVSHKLIEEPTIAGLLPLYAGCISQERAEHLFKLLTSKKYFATKWQIPSVPLTSGSFDPFKYWQGPVWLNTNWLVIDGLKRLGFETEASNLRSNSLELAAKSGMNEYFNPLNGQAAGAAGFSWTAALAIDFLND
jgi:hypothetical protein